MMPAVPDSLATAPATAESMADYYARRAAVYERVYLKPERQFELRQIEASLGPVFAGRRVLEIACGTGWWTPHGAAQAAHWRATDLNPETMALARRKPLPEGIVRFQTVDAYSLAELDPDETFDAAFAGCWWSHVPLQRLQPWLATLHAHLRPGAQVLMLDNTAVPGSSTPLSRCDDQGNTYQMRQLDDGSPHEVLKNYPTPEQAIAALGPRARDPQWTAHRHFWLLSYRLA